MLPHMTGAMRKTGLSGGGDRGREGKGLAFQPEDRIGPPLQRRAPGANAPAGGVPVSPPISSRAQGPLDQHRATPERSLDQRMNALSKANEVRAHRTQLKRDGERRRGH